MKAKNYNEVTRGYFNFTISMLVLITFFIVNSRLFISTTKIEYNIIMDKTVVFDETHLKQIDIVDRVDSLYNYMSLINSNNRINNAILQGNVSGRKMQLQEYVSIMSIEDVLIYNKLMEQTNTFLTIKEEISSLSTQEQFIKQDLTRCIKDNKELNRKLNIGGAK